MVICRKCGLHRFEDNKSCPHCFRLPNAKSSGVRRTALALLMGFSTVGCGDKEDDTSADTGDIIVDPEPGADLYGVPMVDEDGDGFYADDGDCNDQDPNINPNAEEVPGDGTDSNAMATTIRRGDLLC